MLSFPKLVAFWGFLGLSGILLFREHAKTTFLIRAELPLKQAAYAETPYECQRHLSVAISHLNSLGLTKTTELMPADPKSPSVQAWFNGLVEIQGALERSHLEQHRSANDMLLLLIRGRLMVENAGQLNVLLPVGAQTYPYTEFFFWWGWLSLATTVLGILWWWRKNT